MSRNWGLLTATANGSLISLINPKSHQWAQLLKRQQSVANFIDEFFPRSLKALGLWIPVQVSVESHDDGRKSLMMSALPFVVHIHVMP